MSHAVAKLSGQTLVTPGPEANICHRDENNDARFYRINPVGEGLDEWFASFQAAQCQDGSTARDRFYEVMKKDAITKFSLRFASGAQDEGRIRSACGYVAHKLLATDSYELSDVSYWYRLDGFVYGIWPMIAMTPLDRQVAADLLSNGPQDQWSPFQLDWLSHYNNGDHTEFPLPAAGAQWIGVFDHNCAPKHYVASRHGRRMGHLVVNGGFLFNADPAVSALQIANVYRALRIGLLTNLLTTQARVLVPKDPGYNAAFTTRRAVVREHQRLRRDVPALRVQRPAREYDRLNWLHALEVWDETVVEKLDECLSRDLAEHAEAGGTELPEYFHTYNQLNRLLLYEMGTTPATLWHKTYDQKRYCEDRERPERYLTIATILPATVRQTLDRIKLMLPNPGKPSPRYVNALDAWLSHPRCNRVNMVVTSPLPSDASLINPYGHSLFNRWRGYDFYSHGHYDRLHAEHHQKSLAQLLAIKQIRTVNAFVYGMLCDQDIDGFRMLTLILANVLQRPDSKPEKAIFLKGPEGVGKSLFSKSLVSRVFGFTHSAEFDRTEHILGHFNDAASGKAFIALEEALISDDEAVGRFQQLITGEYLQVNAKYQSVRSERSFATFMAMTNRDFPISVNKNGRRFLMLLVSSLVEFLNAKQKVGFFNEIASILDSDDIFLYAYFLARLPLDNWFAARKAAVLENAELGKMKIISMHKTNPVLAWLMSCAQARTFGRLDNAEKDVLWGEPAPLRDLYELFQKTRKSYTHLRVFTHEFCVTLGHVKGFNPKYAVDQRQAELRGSSNASWVLLPQYDDALAAMQARVAGAEEVGSIESIAKTVEHEAKLMKVSEAPRVTAEMLLPSHDPSDPLSLMLALFGDETHVVVPCYST